EDAEEIGCLAEVNRARDIISRGTGADRQLAALEGALGRGESREDAMKQVVDMLIAETVLGL
ncbi:MAG: carboxylate--amine ligase, partial [Hyphomicrobiaceae bacterium]